MTLASAPGLEAQSSYQMLVNSGSGGRESAGFDNLEACKQDATAFAKRYAIQAGCAETRALERWRADENYQQRAARCSEQSEVGIARKPSTYFKIFGTARDYFETPAWHRTGRPPADRGQPMKATSQPGIRERIAQGFTLVEDAVYLSLALLLAAGAIGLVGHTARIFGQVLAEGTLASGAVAVLDRVLLVLMVVELLYTVQVSFREHRKAPSPFSSWP